MELYYEQEGITIYHGDAMPLMAAIPSNSVDLVLTDPPYYRVKNEAWDRQWDTAAGFLAWLDECAEQWHRVLKPNGSLYVFASPQMAARVECQIAERFCVLNRIRWTKEAGWHNKAEKEALRSFLSPWEEIIFAEHYGADNIAKGEAGYAAKCDELRGFLFEPLRSYLAEEWERAGLSRDDANIACGTASMAARHFFSRSQWCLPTAEHYAALQKYANRNGGDYLRREYEDLRREYEDLRREYEDLRREYEDLRRPFAVTPNVPYTDVWAFPTVQSYPGKHPCEKPTSLLRHIIQASTRPGAVVLDSFAGSGATGVACQETGRAFVGIEIEERYCEIAAKRLQQSVLPLEIPA